MPVDAIKLNIPTYYDIIAKPMELQTMERKLNNNEYADVESFVDDFKQIVENCTAFNGPEHTITQMSKSMESAFYRHMKDLPGEDVQEIEKPKLSKKKGGLSGAAAISAAKGAAKGAVKAVATKTAKKNSQSLQHSLLRPLLRSSACSPLVCLRSVAIQR
jgi:bromodomain-containing factor 1